MPITITPEPDTTIRILMENKCLNSPIDVEEQKLIQVQRQGYSVVEWGATEID